MANNGRVLAKKEKKPNAFHKSNWWMYALSLLIVIIYLIPLYVTVNMSFKPSTEYGSRLTPPTSFYLDNYVDSIVEGGIPLGLRNTAITAVGVVVVEVILGCAASYPLARNRSRLNKLIYSFCMGVMMIPALSILVGVYTQLVAMNGINHFWAVIAIGAAFGLPMSVNLFTNFINSIPVALDEAAAIDGAGVVRTFWSIILPQLKPVTVSVIILKGVTAWNDYLYPSYILQRAEKYTLVLLVKQSFNTTSSSANVNAAAAKAICCALPIVVLYLCLQKYFIQGQVDSAVK